MIKISRIFRIFILILSCSAAALQADEKNILEITSLQENFSPENALYLYEDASSKKTITDMIASPQLFKKNEWQYPAYGFTKSSVWGKITLKNSSKQIQNLNLIFDFPLLDDIHVYTATDSGISEFKSGNRHGIESRIYPFRQNIVPFAIQENENLDIYFQVRSTDTLELPLRILNDEDLSYYFYRSMFFLGLYYGIVLIMLAYNLFVYFSVRDSTYLYYVLLVFFIGLTQFGLDGFTFSFIAQGNLTLSKSIHAFAGSSAIIMGLLFTMHYFRLRINSPVLYRTFLSSAVFTFVCFLISQYNYFYGIQMVLLCTLIAGIAFITAGKIFYRKFSAAKFYLVAILFSITGATFLALKTFDFYIPFFTRYAMQIGHIFEITLLSFALADRIRILEHEKEDLRINKIRLETKNQEHLYEMEILQIKNKNMEEDLNVAREIQMRLISESIPERNIITMYHPMDRVGGDIIDIIQLSEHETGIFLGDVSGHGLPASLITIMIKSHISSVKNREILYSPVDFLDKLNKALSYHLRDEFVSAFYGVYDHKSNQMTYKSAGHPPPLFMHQDKSSGKPILNFLPMKPQLRLLGPIFNMLQDPNARDLTIQFPPETRILFYSDGLFDSADYFYQNSDLGVDSFKNTFLYEWLEDTFNCTMDEWALKLSEVLYLNRENWVVDDDISAVFLESK